MSAALQSAKTAVSGAAQSAAGQGGAKGDGFLSRTRGVVPAFVIPSKTPYDPTPNTDGSYNLIL